MPRHRCASMAPPTMWPDNAAVSCLSTARAKHSWISCNEGIGGLQHLVGFARLFEEYLERGNVGIPFDQGRNRAKAGKCTPIEAPYRLRHALPMGVDQHAVALVKAGQ